MDSDVIKVWNTREGINLEWDICNEEIFSERTDWFSGKDLITQILMSLSDCFSLTFLSGRGHTSSYPMAVMACRDFQAGRIRAQGI